MLKNDEKLGIKSWAEQDRPREKLLLKGKSYLTNAELLAILIGSGNKEDSAVALCQKIMHLANNNLNQLGKLNTTELQQLKGIGQAKAITIVAALELGKRRQAEPVKERKQITCSKDAYHLLLPNLIDLPYEELWAIFLNQNNKVINYEKISQGGISATVFDARIIFKRAIEHLASGIIISHNHPSGNLQPSAADIELTKNLKESGKLLGINLLDHLIITENNYLSLADEGLF